MKTGAEGIPQRDGRKVVGAGGQTAGVERKRNGTLDRENRETRKNGVE